MPESPVWLRSQHRYHEARNSLVWLKLPPPPARTSSSPMEKDIGMVRTKEDDKSNETKSNFFTRPVLMPLGIGLSLLVLQQISGIDAIIFFTVEIFHASGTTTTKNAFKKKKHRTLVSFNSFRVGSSVNHHLATIIVGLVQLISNILALFVVDKSGRKPLLITSAVTMSISMAGMGTAFYLKQQNIHSFG